MPATYEVLAIRYAHLERTARHNFLGGDEHDQPMPLDYYVWAIVGAERTVIVDTGFDANTARQRGRQLVRWRTASRPPASHRMTSSIS
jgi:hypothetical protein